MTSSLTDALVALVADRTPGDDAWSDIGERAFVDTVGVLLAGAGEPAVALTAAVTEIGPGPVRSLATGRLASARSAALVDGTSAHALDRDDVDAFLVAHLSAVLVPALLAAGQQEDASGVTLLDSFRVGVLASRAVGMAIGIPGHYAAGWHSTSTIGSIGAAAAVSRLLGVDADAARHALGVAGSLAAGSRQSFGSMVKPLHAGHAASTGVMAGYLARSGFVADAELLEGPLGFLALHRGAPDASPVLAAPPAGSGPVGLNVKLFPCCYATHQAAEAAIVVAERVEPGSQIRGVEVTVHPGGLAPLIDRPPQTADEARFSMRHIVAHALLDGRVDASTFTSDSLRRTDVADLMSRIDVRTAEVPPIGPSDRRDQFAVVTVTLGDRSETARVDEPLGHVTRPLSEAQLRDKFLESIAQAGSPVDAAYSALRGLREQSSARDVAELVLAVRADGAGVDS